MKRTSTHNLSTADRPLELRARGDLQIVPVSYSAQAAYVVKDPLTLELTHLSVAEHFLLESLREVTSLSRLRKEFQKRFAPTRVTLEKIQQGLNQLYSQGLLLSTATGQGQQLEERARTTRNQQRLQSLFSLLSFRLGSIDATSPIDGLHSRVRWLFTMPMLILMVGIVAYACKILVSQGSEVLARLPSLEVLSQPKYWLLWIATIAIVKVVHELAHAVACQHFGGRCHEMGMLLLACLPCLYCDVSDIWRLPSKWQRIAVSAAGMIAEFVLASLALILWWHTQPGLLNTWCLSVVIVCTVGTLLVNANPLLRYDGYYILADLVEVPNLAPRAQQLIPSAVQHWLLGQPQESDSLLSRQQRRGLVVYAVAARAYLLFVILGIFVMLLAWTRPHQLENLVYTLAAITVVGMIYRPLRGIAKLARNPSVRARMRKGRATLLICTLLVALGLFLFWPIKQTVSGPVVFVPSDGQTVYVTSAGEVISAVEPGTEVQQGDVIARLTNPESTFEIAKAEGEYAVRKVRFQQLSTMRAWQEKSSLQLPTAQAELADAERQLAELEQTAEELILRAPQAGIVIAPPRHKEDRADAMRLATWAGSPLELRNQGAWLEKGTVLCTIGDPDQLEALVAIDQSDIAEVQPGQAVRILLTTGPVRILEGQVKDVARRATERSETEASVDAGKYHLVQVELSQQEASLLVGSRGTAKIESKRMSLGAIASRSLRQMLRLPW